MGVIGVIQDIGVIGVIQDIGVIGVIGVTKAGFVSSGVCLTLMTPNVPAYSKPNGCRQLRLPI